MRGCPKKQDLTDLFDGKHDALPRPRLDWLLILDRLLGLNLPKSEKNLLLDNWFPERSRNPFSGVRLAQGLGMPSLF